MARLGLHLAPVALLALSLATLDAQVTTPPLTMPPLEVPPPTIPPSTSSPSPTPSRVTPPPPSSSFSSGSSSGGSAGDAGSKWSDSSVAPSSPEDAGFDEDISSGAGPNESTGINSTAASWDGLWQFKGGWNWGSPLPPAGITLETDVNGELALQPRRRVDFNISQGFSTSHVDTSSPSPATECLHRFCLRISITSSYGGMSDFDAFVMDRYESKDAIGSDAFTANGPAPLVTGRLTPAELEHIFGNDSSAAVASYRHARQTTWLLYPLAPNATEIDVVMSFKQLYTLLPSYNGTDPSSSGPFYSADPNDQVILRVSARLASAFSATTALLPLVFEHTGSRLFDVTYTSELVFSDESSDTTNLVALDLVFRRKMYGGVLPWLPVRPTGECVACDAQLNDAISFGKCLWTRVDDAVFADLLTPERTNTSFDLASTRDACFDAIWSTSLLPDADAGATSVHAAAAADAYIQCFVASQCPLSSDGNMRLSDAHMVVLTAERASVRVECSMPDFAFRLELAVLNDHGLVTDEISSALAPEDIARAVQRAVPLPELRDALGITARVTNNSDAIAFATRANEWLMDEYAAAVASETAMPKASDAGSDGSGETAASGGGSNGEWSAAGPSNTTQGDPATSSGSQQGARRLASLPMLFDVPTLTYTVEITFHNMSVVPVVTAVTSAQPVSWTYAPLQLALERVPLNLDKFAYVPPPPSVVLEPYPDADDSLSGRGFAVALLSLAGSCAECSRQLVACAGDDDCLFGVRAYFYPRLQPSIFQSGGARVDLTSLFAAAGTFVPFAGVAKFSAFMACLAERAPACNVGGPSYMATTTGNATTGNATTGLDASPSVVEIEPATVAVTLPHGAHFTVHVNGQTVSFVEDGDAAALKATLEALLMTSVDVHITSQDATTNAYKLVFRSLLHGAARVTSLATNVDVQGSTPTVFIGRQSNETTTTLRPDWTRLLTWFEPLLPGWKPDTGASAGTDFTQPTAPTNLDTICAVCSYKLSACLEDSDCQAAAFAFFKALETTAAATPFVQPDGTHELPFMTALDTVLNPPVTSTLTTPDAFLDLLNCVIANYCAVGYSASTAAATASTPTTIAAGQFVAIVVAANSTIELAFAGATFAFVDTGSDLDLRQFLEKTVLKYTAGASVVATSVSDGNTRYTIRVNRVLRSALTIVPSPAIQVLAHETFATFITWGPAAPNWSSLLAWFSAQAAPASGNSGSGAGATTTFTADVCLQCLPSILECASDAGCSAALRDIVLPQLTAALASPATAMELSATFEGFSTIFSLDVTSARASLLAATASALRNPSAALECLASHPCDLAYPSDATLPPATAHAPTYLRFQPASADIVLFEGSDLTVRLQGQTYVFTQPAGDASVLVSWLTTLLQEIRDVSFSIASAGASGEFVYTVMFETRNEPLPEFEAFGGGGGTSAMAPQVFVSPARLWLESVNLVPSWPKLINLLSLSSSSPSSASTTTAPLPFECPQCVDTLKRCFSDAECQFVLRTYALPPLRSLTPKDSNGPTFVADLAPTMTSNVLPSTANDELLIDIFRCTATSACADASVALAFPGAYPNAFPDLYAGVSMAPPTANLTLPLGAQMTITFEGVTHAFADSDNTAALEDLFATAVLAGRGVRVNIKRIVDATSTPSTATYVIVFDGLYTLYPPHLSWQNPEPSQPGTKGAETPWRLEFSSSMSDLAKAFGPWVNWLATNAFTTPPML